LEKGFIGIKAKHIMSNVIINSPIRGKDKTAKRAVNDGAAQPLDFGHQQEAKFAHQRGQRIPDGRVEQQRVWVTNPSAEYKDLHESKVVLATCAC
jgi:hypothetical protein